MIEFKPEYDYPGGEQSLEKFNVAITFTKHEERGISNRSKTDDPGGLTKDGITHHTWDAYKRTFPGRLFDGKPLPAMVTDASCEMLLDVYFNFYWIGTRNVWLLPTPLAVCVFDTSVMSGPIRGAKLLQSALGGCTIDGHIGGQTIARAAMANTSYVVARFCFLRKEWLQTLPNANANPGWFPRTDRLLEYAKFC